MSSSSKETQQSQSSSSQPWAQALPLVNSLLSQYGNQSTGVTANQGGALSNLASSVSNLPNFGDAAAGGVNSLFKSADSSGQVGMLTGAYDTLKSNLGGTASGANLNPYDTPGFGDAIRTAINDTTNQVKGVYAGSGRDPSGAGSFAQSLGRGITAGISPTIANQSNQNYSNMVNANNLLLQGAGSTASGINNLRQGDTATTLAGITGASSIPGLYSSPAAAQYAIANQQYAQPYQNLAQLLQPSIALAGLGTTSQGQGTSTQTSNPSWLDTISGGMNILGGGLSSLGTFGKLGGTAGIAAMFSDRRLKTDIEKVGKLHDGQNVYSYRYKGTETPQLGLMADEVEKRHPEAVAKHPSGFKMVRYDLATRGSRVGALKEAA